MPLPCRLTRLMAAAVLAAAVLVACNPQPPPTVPTDPFSYLIDTSIEPHQSTITGPEGPRSVAALRDAAGLQYDYIAGEVILLPSSQSELDAFLARRLGEVVADLQEDGAERTVVVRLDPSAFPLDRLVEDADRVGVPGEHRFSSEVAARLMALVLREQAMGLKVASNGLHQADQVVLLAGQERDGADLLMHPAFDHPVSKPRVREAWQYMAARSLAGPHRRVRVAIIDGGFFVNADGSSVADANGASDWPAVPLQHDFVTNASVITGVNPARCSGGAVCPWHGHGSASVATGTLDNGAYAAGTGGQVADPILLHTDLSTALVKAAMDRARAWGAEVINLSFGRTCPWICRQQREIAGYYNAFARAHAAGIVMVAAAGNDGRNSADDSREPCVIDDVICVGALGTVNADDTFSDSNLAIDYSNHGSAVHLWAPTSIPAWYGTGAMPGVETMGGTSASAPYVAGVVAMMKSVDASLSPAQVRAILLETAWTDSPDPKVGRYLDAFGAVRRAAKDVLPADRFEPNDSSAAATPLSPGVQQDLTIDRGNDADFFRLAVPGPTLATVDLTYPGGLGRMSLPPFGREATQTCSTTEQVGLVREGDALGVTYRLSAGDFVFAATSPSNPLPYHLDLGLAPAAIAADRYEPNDAFETATNLGDGGYVHASLHGLSDVDYYRVHSSGSFSTLVLTMHSRANVESSDHPLTLQVFNSSGVLLGTATSSANCSSQASLELPQGFHVVRVSGPGIGAYRLWLGSYGVQHPLIDVETWFYLILHPNVPIEFVVREPETWFVIDHLSDFPLRALELEGAGLHLRLYDESGLELLAEGVPHQDLQGATLTVPGGVDELTLLRVSRTEPTLPGAELPLIPATLTAME